MENSSTKYDFGLLGKKVVLKEDSLLYVCDTQYPVEKIFLAGTKGECWHRGYNGEHLPTYALVTLEDGTAISSFEHQWEEMDGN